MTSFQVQNCIGGFRRHTLKRTRSLKANLCFYIVKFNIFWWSKLRCFLWKKGTSCFHQDLWKYLRFDWVYDWIFFEIEQFLGVFSHTHAPMSQAKLRIILQDHDIRKLDLPHGIPETVENLWERRLSLMGTSLCIIRMLILERNIFPFPQQNTSKTRTLLRCFTLLNHPHLLWPSLIWTLLLKVYQRPPSLA